MNPRWLRLLVAAAALVGVAAASLVDGDAADLVAGGDGRAFALAAAEPTIAASPAAAADPYALHRSVSLLPADPPPPAAVLRAVLRPSSNSTRSGVPPLPDVFASRAPPRG